jgi:hypothetical protein
MAAPAAISAEEKVYLEQSDTSLVDAGGLCEPALDADGKLVYYEMNVHGERGKDFLMGIAIKPKTSRQGQNIYLYPTSGELTLLNHVYNKKSLGCCIKLCTYLEQSANPFLDAGGIGEDDAPDLALTLVVQAKKRMMAKLEELRIKARDAAIARQQQQFEDMDLDGSVGMQKDIASEIETWMQEPLLGVAGDMPPPVYGHGGARDKERKEALAKATKMRLTL